MANAFNQFAEGYGQGQDMAQGFARQRAGNALAGGDYAGGANALFKAGDIGSGLAVQQYGHRDETQDSTEAAHKLEFLGKAARVLRQIPDDGTQAHRRAALQRLTPTLQAMGLDPQTMQALQTADLSDQALDMFANTTDQHIRTIQQGRHVRGINDQTGKEAWAYDLPNDPGATKGLPQGFRQNADSGDLEIDPGYLQGKAALAKATRAPLRGRSGGGGAHPGYGGLPPGYRPK